MFGPSDFPCFVGAFGGGDFGSAYGSLKTPTRSDSVPEQVIADAKHLRPLLEAEGFTVMREHQVTAVIPGLLLASRPSAIFWRIAFVVVDAIKHQALLIRRLHIFKKVMDVVPAFANGDPSASVRVKPLVLGAITSSHHGSPGAENGISPFPVRHNSLTVSATATGRMTSLNMVNANVLRRRTAIALAQCVVAIRASNFAGFENGQPVKLITRLIRSGLPFDELAHVSLLSVCVLTTLTHILG